MISSIFIRRPRMAIVISLIITLAGAMAYKALPVAQFPDIVPPKSKSRRSIPAPTPVRWSNPSPRSSSQPSTAWTR
jgi:Cu/Ag efflux pump CusA